MPHPGSTGVDQDALLASIDLVRRTGAKVEFGFLHDDVPIEEADWWATAHYPNGTRITIEHMTGPVEAVEALARRLLRGGMCRRCKKPIVLNDDSPGCRWTRVGAEWKHGCDEEIDHSVPIGPQ